MHKTFHIRFPNCFIFKLGRIVLSRFLGWFRFKGAFRNSADPGDNFYNELVRDWAAASYCRLMQEVLTLKGIFLRFDRILQVARERIVTLLIFPRFFLKANYQPFYFSFSLILEFSTRPGASSEASDISHVYCVKLRVRDQNAKHAA